MLFLLEHVIRFTICVIFGVGISTSVFAQHFILHFTLLQQFDFILIVESLMKPLIKLIIYSNIYNKFDNITNVRLQI